MFVTYGDIAFNLTNSSSILSFAKAQFGNSKNTIDKK